MKNRNKRILLVDDDKRLIDALKDYLEDQGYEVSTTSEGLKAYPLAASRQPALIILDVDMPATNGFQVLDKLRADPETANIPVIVMSGVVSSVVYPAIEHLYLVSHVKKPVNPEDLLSVVRHYIPESV